MRGYTYRESPDDKDLPGLERWEELAVNAVGHVIEFWGFKRNHGRVWALLFLRGDPMASSDLQQELDLSKGAVSMMSRDLEQWGVTHRMRVKGSNAWHFVAEVDFLKMLRRVIKERELEMVQRVRDDLTDALYFAQDDDSVDDETLSRLSAMVRLANMVADAISFFLKTLHLDFSEADEVLDAEDTNR